MEGWKLFQVFLFFFANAPKKFSMNGKIRKFFNLVSFKIFVHEPQNSVTNTTFSHFFKGEGGDGKNFSSNRYLIVAPGCFINTISKDE